MVCKEYRTLIREFTLTKGCMFHVLSRVDAVIVVATREGQHDLYNYTMYAHVASVTNHESGKEIHFTLNKTGVIPTCSNIKSSLVAKNY